MEHAYLILTYTLDGAESGGMGDFLLALAIALIILFGMIALGDLSDILS